MSRKTSIAVVATLIAACAFDDTPPATDSPLAVARVESVRAEPQAPQWLDAFGPTGRALLAWLDRLDPVRDVMVRTRTGERVVLAIDTRAGRTFVPGDCVGIVALDPRQGLRERYPRGRARLEPDSGCDELGK